MKRNEYVRIVGGLVSGDPQKVREANRELYQQVVVQDAARSDTIVRTEREADLALAQAVNQGRG